VWYAEWTVVHNSLRLVYIWYTDVSVLLIVCGWNVRATLDLGRRPSLACTRAPRKPRPRRRPSRLFWTAARRLPPVPAVRMSRATVCPSKPRPVASAAVLLLYIDAGCIACCPLVSPSEYADRTDGRTDGRQTVCYIPLFTVDVVSIIITSWLCHWQVTVELRVLICVCGVFLLLLYSLVQPVIQRE